jgi:Protein of unknown function (DUF3386)
MTRLRQTMTEVTNKGNDQARAIFRAAYENRYTWDANFPGYTADISLKRGDEVFTGQVRIPADGMKAEVMNVADEQAKKEIAEQAWEIGVHRVRRAFEQTHGENVFTLGETDKTGAVEIFVEGKAMGDRYKVRDNEVCLVYRRIRNVIVTINTYTSHKTPEGYLSHRYDSAYHDAETGEAKGESDFEDTYEKVGGYYILTKRLICSTQNGEDVTHEYSFSNVRLLQPAVV